MKKRIVVVLFFIVVFGLPIFWYLVLQIFGENKFDLPKLGLIDSTCVERDNVATLLIDSSAINNHINELNRLLEQFVDIDSNDLKMSYSINCLNNSEALLIDHLGVIRGEYLITREEMDRMLTEMDIYLLNLKGDKK
jgi:hypothetical protein